MTIRRSLATAMGVTCVAAVACTGGGAPIEARSAVLFIGDGMGQAYVTATRLARGGPRGRLRLDDLPYTALVRTCSADRLVTDSAAAASAMGCGQKTVNGVLCEDASAVYARQDGKKLESIAVWAKKRGMKVGLVTTTPVTDATPAAFYATSNNRENERDVARQAIVTGFDFLLGGGRQFFRPIAAMATASSSATTDTEDLLEAARARGWTILDSAPALRGVTSTDGRVWGLFSDEDLPYQPEIDAARKKGRGGDSETAPTLLEMTHWAIDWLQKSGRPFFLMVEGGRIDHAGHANWARTLVDETAAFDDTVGYAVDTLDPKTTLVLVTADHETGGLAINGYTDEKEGIWGPYRDPRAGKGND